MTPRIGMLGFAPALLLATSAHAQISSPPRSRVSRRCSPPGAPRASMASLPVIRGTTQRGD